MNSIETQFAEVALPLPLYQSFTYEIPSEFDDCLLKRVLVPFGRRKIVGVVINVHKNKPNLQLKKIEAVLDEVPLFSSIIFEWLNWAAHYTLTPIGEVLQSAVPPIFFKPFYDKELALKKVRSPVLDSYWLDEKKVELSLAQKNIVNRLNSSSNEFKSYLLYGITGSGKTEIYIQLIQSLLSQGKQVIFMVPEIGLTPQVVARFQTLFGKQLALTHSSLTENQRLTEWLKAKNNQAQLMVGTRSALFTPFENLGAIIIDEEHDSSFKQEERFRYHARDLALVRAKMQKAFALMGSATPSLESYSHALNQKYELLTLTERAPGAQLPKVRLIDMASQMRQTGAGSPLSRELIKAIENTLSKKEQILILNNQRGFARALFCLECQTTVNCLNCSIAMTYHKKPHQLLCHYCDDKQPVYTVCPHCNSHRLTLLGFGTENIEEEIKTFFPKASVARLDRDVTRKKGALIQILKNLRDKKIDILVGTQMIAKGHDIPNVTLVGVIGLDHTLNLPDFRASERTFQLITQVAGRAGRGELCGEVIIQSFNPNHFSIQQALKQDYDAFFKQEISHRKDLNYPPFGRLVLFQFSSSSQTRLNQFINQLSEWIGNPTGDITLLGPAPAPLEKIQGRYRWQMILKAAHVNPLKKAALKVIDFLNELNPSTIKWTVDVDPISML